MKYLLEVEKDDLDKGMFMVCIFKKRSGERELLGIPLRNATQKECKEQIESLRFAFEYGLRAAYSETISKIQTLPREAR